MCLRIVRCICLCVCVHVSVTGIIRVSDPDVIKDIQMVSKKKQPYFLSVYVSVTCTLYMSMCLCLCVCDRDHSTVVFRCNQRHFCRTLYQPICLWHLCCMCLCVYVSVTGTIRVSYSDVIKDIQMLSKKHSTVLSFCLCVCDMYVVYAAYVSVTDTYNINVAILCFCLYFCDIYVVYVCVSLSMCLWQGPLDWRIQM